jgi:hypothetical protein
MLQNRRCENAEGTGGGRTSSEGQRCSQRTVPIRNETACQLLGGKIVTHTRQDVRTTDPVSLCADDHIVPTLCSKPAGSGVCSGICCSSRLYGTAYAERPNVERERGLASLLPVFTRDKQRWRHPADAGLSDLHGLGGRQPTRRAGAGGKQYAVGALNCRPLFWSNAGRSMYQSLYMHSLLARWDC